LTPVAGHGGDDRYDEPVSSAGNIVVGPGTTAAAATVAPELGLPGRIAVIGMVIVGALVGVPSGLGLIWFIPYAVVGALLAIRRPRTSIGWILLAVAWLGVTVWTPVDANQFTDVSVSWPLRLFALVHGAAGPVAFLLLALLAVVFPSGRLPTGRWGTVVRVALITGLLVILATPILLEATSDLVLVLAFGAVISLGVRYRGAGNVERLQIRWLVAALAFLAVAVMVGFGMYYLLPGSDESGLVWIPAIAAFPTVPIAIGIAVLRYRLYEIDTIINRAVLYGGVTIVLLSAFAIANIGLQRLLESLTGQRSDLLTAALGVGVGLAYGPLRRRVRPLVDRFLPSRALLTLLFTDIVRSTEHIVELGDEGWRVLLGRYRAAVRHELARTHGHEVDTAGDSFFATFDRPNAGVRCASAIRSGVEQLGLQTRTGVHLGECEMRGEEVSGIEVHAAARVMAEAADGEILLSGAVRDAISAAEFSTIDRGPHELKGVPGEWNLYALEPLSGDTTG
jgi:class 3 adenylate cyclase